MTKPNAQPKPKPRCRSCSDVSVLDHTAWVAKVVAGPIARAAGLIGPDREDVIAAAQLRLCEIAARKPSTNPADPQPFDPSRVPAGGNAIEAFRGFAYHSVFDAAKCEANRIRTGGLVRRKVRPENLAKVKCTSLGDAATQLVRSRPDEGDESAVEREHAEPDHVVLQGPQSTYGRRLAGGVA